MSEQKVAESKEEKSKPAYAHQADLDAFLISQRDFLFHAPQSWLQQNRISCPMSDNKTHLLNLENVQPHATTHRTEFLHYAWDIGRPGKFVVDSMEHYDKMGYNVSCRAGAINVILLPTQTIDDGLSFLDFKPTYEFRGTKLVPLPSQVDTASHEPARILLKTTQTSGCWLGFGRDKDGALWAIHIQPKLKGLSLKYVDMRTTAKEFTILANDTELEILKWLDPKMYYWGDTRVPKKSFFGGGTTATPLYHSQIVGFPATAAATPDWTFFIQLFVTSRSAETYTVLSFKTTAVGQKGDLLKHTGGKDPPPPPEISKTYTTSQLPRAPGS